jgi:hypothetical protein
VHKTHDHTMYYKCADVGQALIVYEDENAMDEAESAAGYNQEGFPSYYHSGLTPPMKRVVERRFEAREHKSVAPPRSEVMDVEVCFILLIKCALTFLCTYYETTIYEYLLSQFFSSLGCMMLNRTN